MAQEIRMASQGLSEQVAYAQAVSKAGILPDAYRGRPADIIVAMGLGQSMGLSPMESLYRINVIKGKPTASAELIAAQVRKAGHKLRISKDEERQSVTATIIRADDPGSPFSVTRDKAWADRMSLSSKDNYRKQPMTMLTWRAITAVAREACPEALYGVAYTPDEMHDMDAPEPIQAQAVAVEEAPAEEPDQAVPEEKEDPLQAVRDLFPAYREATGYDAQTAMALIEEYVGKPSMQDFTEEDCRVAEGYMRDVIETAALREADGE